MTVSADPLLLDLGMRAAGLVLFLALALRNRRKLAVSREQAEPASA